MSLNYYLIHYRMIFYLTTLIKKFLGKFRKVFPLSRPRKPFLPPSGYQWGKALAKRYPGVCRVCAQSGFVFEQIGKYCDRLRPFLNFFEKLMFKVKVLNQKIFRKIPKSISAFSPPQTKSAAIWSAGGARSRDALPGGVLKVGPIHVRFRANPEILWPSKTLYELFWEINV